ncbi:MAG: lysylphosphatidylglycerol synthase transmembrane domain-containing protein [Chloroflexi bacterium]|nr:lysylphosphatidylglycerol synthase transmembrane domain-containing protein [Chloroflexota bacterium]MDA1270217.1 lysylphosphatidylglycerol synthase transmembrane domain-containing protein [Chloroflexota bacterium]
MKTATVLSSRLLMQPKLRLVLGLAVGVGIGFAVVKDMDWGSLSAAFNEFPVRYMLLSLAIFALATAMRAYRWQVLFIKRSVPLHRLLLVQNIGIGLNSVSPIRVISEVTQFFLLTLRYRVRGEEVAATLGVQRVLDFVIAAILLGLGVMVLPSLKGFIPYVIGAVVLALVSVLAVPAVIWFGSRPGLTHLQLLASTSSSLQGLIQARLRLAWSFLLTMGYWLLLGLSAWVLAYGMDIDISPMVATLLVIGTLTFVALVPSLPASVGTFEFAVFYLLTTIGVGDGDALGFALVIHAILFLPPILISIMAFATWAITGRRHNIAADLLSSEPATVKPPLD